MKFFVIIASLLLCSCIEGKRTGVSNENDYIEIYNDTKLLEKKLENCVELSM